MKKILYLLVLLFTTSVFAQLPPAGFADGIETKLVKLDTLTTVQKLALPQIKGTVVYDVTLNRLESFNGTSWVAGTGGGSLTWGGITGTLSNQTDLQNALDAKAGLSSNAFTGTQTWNGGGFLNGQNIIGAALDPYDATWNGSTKLATQNDIYDKIETISSVDLSGYAQLSANNTFTGTQQNFIGRIGLNDATPTVPFTVVHDAPAYNLGRYIVSSFSDTDLSNGTGVAGTMTGYLANGTSAYAGFFSSLGTLPLWLGTSGVDGSIRIDNTGGVAAPNMSIAEITALGNPALITKEYADANYSGGGGATNLTYTASPTNGLVNSDTGTNATIPLADGTNAGLISPSEKDLIASALQNGDNVSELINDAGYITLGTRTIKNYRGLAIEGVNLATWTTNNLAAGVDLIYFDSDTGTLQWYDKGTSDWLSLLNSSSVTGHTIQDDTVNQTQRSNLNFDYGLNVTDDLANDRTTVKLDTTSIQTWYSDSPLKPVRWVGTQAQHDAKFGSGYVHPTTDDITILDATPPALTAADITDFDTEVSNNASVVDNTSKISFDSTSSTRLANTSGTNTGDDPFTATKISEATANAGLIGTEKVILENAGGLEYTTTQDIADLGGGGSSTTLEATLTITNPVISGGVSVNEIIAAPGIGKQIAVESFNYVAVGGASATGTTYAAVRFTGSSTNLGANELVMASSGLTYSKNGMDGATIINDMTNKAVNVVINNTVDQTLTVTVFCKIRYSICDTTTGF